MNFRQNYFKITFQTHQYTQPGGTRPSELWRCVAWYWSPDVSEQSRDLLFMGTKCTMLFTDVGTPEGETNTLSRNVRNKTLSQAGSYPRWMDTVHKAAKYYKLVLTGINRKKTSILLWRALHLVGNIQSVRTQHTQFNFKLGGRCNKYSASND
jgi:hypothetical protein